MIDHAIASRDLMELLPQVRERYQLLWDAMDKAGHPVRIIEGYRSPERQEWLYAMGRSAPGKIVTRARAWQSWHQTRRAFDVCFSAPDPFGESNPWQILGQTGEMFGLEWGGRWTHPDRPHFQLTEGLTLAQAAQQEKVMRVNQGGDHDSMAP